MTQERNEEPGGVAAVLRATVDVNLDVWTLRAKFM